MVVEFAKMLSFATVEGLSGSEKPPEQPSLKNLGSAILVMLYLKQVTQKLGLFGMVGTRAYWPALLGYHDPLSRV
jgi:hypothetical protein